MIFILKNHPTKSAVSVNEFEIFPAQEFGMFSYSVMTLQGEFLGYLDTENLEETLQLSTMKLMYHVDESLPASTEWLTYRGINKLYGLLSADERVSLAKNSTCDFYDKFQMCLNGGTVAPLLNSYTHEYIYKTLRCTIGDTFDGYIKQIVQK